MTKIKLQWWVVLLVILVPGVCPGQELDRIVSTSPAWAGFTGEDGKGLYHEILAEIFTSHKIKVVHTYSNANRGIQLVRKGLADLYTCKTDTIGFQDLTLGRYPMYEGIFHAIFKKARTQPWHGPQSLGGKRVVWRTGYYSPAEFRETFTILEADSGEEALFQVTLGRADFYIDDLNLIRESVAKTKGPISMADYQIEPVGKRSYFPVFNSSPRGTRIRALYEKGIEDLHRSGRLRQIFDKWHHPYPGYAIP